MFYRNAINENVIGDYEYDIAAAPFFLRCAACIQVKWGISDNENIIW